MISGLKLVFRKELLRRPTLTGKPELRLANRVLIREYPFNTRDCHEPTVSASSPTRIRIEELIRQFHAGDSAATARLFGMYNRILRAAVRRRLPPSLRDLFESRDFSQDVWTALCETRDRANRFDDSSQFRSYLVEIAVNKVIDAHRRIRTVRRGGGTREALGPVPGREPTPSQHAIVGERWESLSKMLPPAHVEIVERLKEGFTVQEVAEMLGVSCRTVGRVVKRTRRLCQEAQS